MRYLQVRLAAGDATLHPLVSALTDPDVFRNAMMLEWTPSFDPPRANVLLYLEGDLDRFPFRDDDDGAITVRFLGPLDRLRAALEAGYYAVPREASRADVAAALGCAPSTASEHLRKAERRLVRTFLDRPG